MSAPAGIRLCGLNDRSCRHQVLQTSGPADVRSCTRQVLHTSGPAHVRSCSRQALHTSGPADVRSCTSGPAHQVLQTSGPADVRSCTRQVLHIRSCTRQVLQTSGPAGDSVSDVTGDEVPDVGVDHVGIEPRQAGRVAANGSKADHAHQIVAVAGAVKHHQRTARVARARVRVLAVRAELALRQRHVGSEHPPHDRVLGAPLGRHQAQVAVGLEEQLRLGADQVLGLCPGTTVADDDGRHLRQHVERVVVRRQTDGVGERVNLDRLLQHQHGHVAFRLAAVVERGDGEAVPDAVNLRLVRVAAAGPVVAADQGVRVAR